MNLKKMISVMTLCAVTTMAGAVPAFANDTASVGAASSNLGAAAAAVSTVAPQITGQTTPSNTETTKPDNSTSNNTGSNDSTADVEPVKAFDYIALESPATSINGNTYLPLRATFAALKNKALTVTWKADGQNKMKLSGNGANYEVYITADGNGLQIEKGGEVYPFESVNGVGYVPLAFFQDIIQTATLGLSGNDILVVADFTGQDVWNNPKSFWFNMHTYTAPVVTPPPAPAPKPETKPSTPPTVTVPSVSTPSKPATPTTPPATKPNTNTSTGTTTKPTTNTSTGMIWPTTVTYITSNFGYREDPFGGIIGDFHLGLDIAGPEGTPIFAAAAGTVVRASWFDSYGNCVDIQHPNGMITRYAHCSALLVNVGDKVSQGQTIAKIGATGNVTGAHLHFETVVNGSQVNPLTYVKKP